jgi:AraC-like DNA-binding protein
MTVDRSVLQALVVPLLHFAIENGLSSEALSAALPVRVSLSDISAVKLRPVEYLNLVEMLIARTGNPNLGLSIGHSSRCAYLGILGYVMMNCKTYREAIQKYIEYQKIGNNVITIGLEVTGNQSILRWLPINETLLPIRQFIIEGSIVSTLKEFEEITGKRLPLNQVGFDWPQPKEISEYKEAFEAEVLFNQPISFISLDSQYLDTPIRQSNTELLTLFENHARKNYQRLRENKPFSDAVILILSKSINHIPGVNTIAGELGLSYKNLQLKLKSEGNTFIGLRNRVQCEFAKRLLMNENYFINEVGYLLGFRESSTFYRTFKRWTGHTPGEYRKQITKADRADTTIEY